MSIAAPSTEEEELVSVLSREGEWGTSEGMFRERRI
jgi:hypothetical protein